MWGWRRIKGGNQHSSEQLGSSIHFGIFAFMLAVTMPRLAHSFCPTWNRIDTSWAWMLGYAVQHQLQWGKSILFTYGPLGFLSRSFFYSDHALWELSATFRLLAWFGFGLGFAAILRRLAPDSRPFFRTAIPIALGWVIGASFVHLSAQSTFIGVMLLALAITEEQIVLVNLWMALAGALLGFGAMIKSTGLIVSLFALLIYPAAWWYAGVRRDRILWSLLPLLTFMVTFCALWALTAQSFANLPAHLRSTWALASGYTPAMSISGMPLQLAWAVAILLLFTVTLIGFIAKRHRIRTAQCLILAGMAFWAWKEGFTRPEWGYYGHPMEFFGPALLIASAGIALTGTEKSRRLSFPAYGAYAIALLCALRGYPTLSLSYAHVLDNYRNYVTLSFSAPHIAAEQRRQNAAIRSEYRLPAPLLRALGENSVNILPWSLMIAQGYHLRLKASPLIQSYSAYEPFLDHANARQIWAGQAAEKIIYRYQTLDQRYPLFDEPAAFRATLDCYRTEYPGTTYTVLSRRTCAPPAHTATAATELGKMGKWVAVPRDADYVRITLHTTLLGHLIDVLFKPAHVRVSFRLSDGNLAGPYRFIYPVGPDGLFIRYFVSSQADFSLLFTSHRSELQRITAIRISTPRYSPDYASQLGVRFIHIALPSPSPHTVVAWQSPGARRTIGQARLAQPSCGRCGQRTGEAASDHGKDAPSEELFAHQPGTSL